MEEGRSSSHIPTQNLMQILVPSLSLTSCSSIFLTQNLMQAQVQNLMQILFLSLMMPTS